MTNSVFCLMCAGLVLVSGLSPQTRKNTTTCPALYYGMGNGDGVLDRRCFDLQSQLSAAAYIGDVKKIRKLLRRGANADSYAGDRFPPLFGAASRGHSAAARLLLDNGAEINRKYTLAGTPLFAAVEGNHVNMVALLLSRGADVNIRNGDDTCLKIARAKSLQPIASLLKNAGAKE